MDTSENGQVEEQVRYKLLELKQSKVQNDTIETELTTGMINDMLAKHKSFYQGINTFDFNLFEFTEVIGRKMQMPFMAMALLK